jgi:GNAT superfamily N-acetyltransferase
MCGGARQFSEQLKQPKLVQTALALTSAIRDNSPSHHVKPSTTIANATERIAIARCFRVMAQLRPHLAEGTFVERVQRQQGQGYHLAYLETGGVVRAVAGYRYTESLSWGRFCYVDDLVTDESERSSGHGRALFDWLLARAREAGCEQFHLDSGVQRFDAHRFYLARRMSITCHHFALSFAQ